MRSLDDVLPDGAVVAIDRDKNSQHAVRWAVDNFWLKDKTIILVHVVNTRSHSHPRSVEDDEPRTLTHAELNQLFLPYRGFFARKGIRTKEVILHDLDVASAILEFISVNSIKTIVLGASNRGTISRAFRNADVATSVGKLAPDFCTVYAISKGKPLKIKSAIEHSTETTTKPFSSLSLDSSARFVREGSRKNAGYELMASDASTTNLGRSFDYSRKLSTSPPNRSKEQSLQKEMPSRSSTPSTPNSVTSIEQAQQHSFTWENQSRNSTPESTSFTSDYEHPDHKTKARHFATQRSNYTSLRGRTVENLPLFSFQSSDRSEELSFQSDYSYEFMDQPKILDSFGSSKTQSAEADDEIRRIKMELKQILELYYLACQETETAKEKVREIVQWDIEKTAKLAQANQGHEAALAVVKKEKQKRKAAIEIAHKAQCILEMETNKRKQAEIKFMHESEEKQKAIDALSLSSTRYRRYSIEEIEAGTNYFSSLNKVGEGGYGPVYKGIIGHTKVAVKVLKSEMSEGMKQFRLEVEVLNRMRHPNVVILLGACPESGILVYEYMENGSLEDRLYCKNNSPPLSWRSRFRISVEIATALNFLHGARPEPLVHRDLKPANILIDRNYISKIGDVGLVRLVPPPVASGVTQYRMTAAAGTFCYIDPEYQQTGMLGTKSDVYSLGVLLLQIITGMPPMGLTHVVESAIEEGRFEEVLDPKAGDWPVEEAVAFAKLGLRCCELRRKDRPDLDSVVLPELERVRELGDRVLSRK